MFVLEVQRLLEARSSPTRRIMQFQIIRWHGDDPIEAEHLNAIQTNAEDRAASERLDSGIFGVSWSARPTLVTLSAHQDRTHINLSVDPFRGYGSDGRRVSVSKAREVALPRPRESGTFLVVATPGERAAGDADAESAPSIYTLDAEITILQADAPRPAGALVLARLDVGHRTVALDGRFVPWPTHMGATMAGASVAKDARQVVRDLQQEVAILCEECADRARVLALQTFGILAACDQAIASPRLAVDALAAGLETGAAALERLAGNESCATMPAERPADNDVGAFIGARCDRLLTAANRCATTLRTQRRDRLHPTRVETEARGVWLRHELEFPECISQIMLGEGLDELVLHVAQPANYVSPEIEVRFSNEESHGPFDAPCRAQAVRDPQQRSYRASFTLPQEFGPRLYVFIHAAHVGAATTLRFTHQ
jgi:hypothetical protein